MVVAVRCIETKGHDMQRTLARPFTVKGIGVHGGQRATATILPASSDSGICFVRTDIMDRDNVIDARFDTVTATALSTTVSNEARVSVSTIEHLMAALAGAGIDNARVEIDGPEMPIMDGSAREFVREILAAGTIDQDEPLRAIRILETIRVELDGKVAALEPSDAFEIAFEITFDDAAIGHQSRTERMTGDSFIRDYAQCRTFCSLGDVEMLRSKGFALGGSLQNAIVVDSGRVLNRGGLRHADEFVRHKMLDAVGDLALAGAPIIGRYVGARAGHDMTNRLLHALFQAPHAWRFEDVADRGAVVPDYATRQPTLRLACA